MFSDVDVNHKRAFDFITSGLEQDITVEDFMRNVFPEKSEKAVSTLKNGVDTDEIQPDTTCELIEHASQAIATLASRCEMLELELRQSADRAFDHSLFINSLKNVVSELKKKSDALEEKLVSISKRCEMSEARVILLEKQEVVTALRIERAEDISKKIQQKVKSAFGTDSPLHMFECKTSVRLAAE